jgi:hypothetical protein
MNHKIFLYSVCTAVACGGCGKEASPAATNQTGSDGASEPADGGADSGIDVDAGYTTTHGIYRCCEPGTGTQCCTDRAQGTCFAYGGVLGRCMAAGEQFEAKDICAGCCEGLVAVTSDMPGNAATPANDGLEEGCDHTAAPSLFRCVACGDGRCGAFESNCNCPADCPN